MTYLAARCVAESDGYHLHEHQVGAITIVEHLHSWNAEHQVNWPDSSLVYVQTGQREVPAGNDLAQAWEEHTDLPMPQPACQLNETSCPRP